MSMIHCTPSGASSVECIGILRRFSATWVNTITGAHGAQDVFATDEEAAYLWMRSELRHRDRRTFLGSAYDITICPHTARAQCAQGG